MLQQLLCLMLSTTVLSQVTKSALWYAAAAVVALGVLQDFWTDLTNSVDVFSIGEVLNGNTRCATGYCEQHNSRGSPAP